MLDIFISSIAMAVAGFSLLLLPKRPSKGPLVLVLGCLLYFSSGVFIFELVPMLVQIYIAFIPTIFFLFLPSFWLYHDATIATDTWHWKRSMGKHFALVPFVLLLSIALVFLPEADFQEMFFSSEMVSSTWLISLSAAFALSLVLWFFLSFGYLWSIFRRNLIYRKQVKLIFADEANRNLNWIILTSCLITFTWIYSLVVLAAENKLQQFGFSETGVLILLSIVVWLVAHKGLKQQGGFSDATETADVISEVTETKAYQNSALRETDLERIAGKLTAALASDKLHLDSSLNLVKLARSIAEPAQYVSQTLSQHLHTTFFDFINKARIDDAKKLLASTNDSVLDIAYATGFNSRSAFYKAFKQYTQQTPREFRLSFPLGKDERSP